MGQISPQDQLISSSAFNDCSVTVIYSGVIITDMLLLCDGPSAPSPSLFCADVIVFFGTTPASFTVVLCIFVVSSSAKCTFASVAWLWDMSHGVSWPTGLSSRAWETITYSPPDQSQRSLAEPEKNTYLHSVMLPLRIKISLSSTLYYQMFIHVWMWVSMHVSNMCTVLICMHTRICAQTLSSGVFFTLLVQTGSPCLNLFGCQYLFFSPLNSRN